MEKTNQNKQIDFPSFKNKIFFLNFIFKLSNLLSVKAPTDEDEDGKLTLIEKLRPK
jgi:hypothetical protein